MNHNSIRGQVQQQILALPKLQLLWVQQKIISIFLKKKIKQKNPLFLSCIEKGFSVTWTSTLVSSTKKLFQFFSRRKLNRRILCFYHASNSFSDHIILKICRQLDDRNLSGHLAPEFSKMPRLKILYVPHSLKHLI